MINKINSAPPIQTPRAASGDGQASGGNAYEKGPEKDSAESGPLTNSPVNQTAETGQPQLTVLEGGKAPKLPGLTNWFSALLKPIKRKNAKLKQANYENQNGDPAKGMLIDEKAE